MSKVTRTCVALVAFVSFTAVAEEPGRAPPDNSAKIHQTDRYGNAQYHEPSYAVQPDGKVIQTDPHGNRVRQKFEIRGDRRAPTKSANGKSSPESARK